MACCRTYHVLTRKEVEAHVIPTVEQIPGSWTFISDLENLLQILVWCGGCLVWWMSSVVDVCVVDVVQSSLGT